MRPGEQKIRTIVPYVRERRDTRKWFKLLSIRRLSVIPKSWKFFWISHDPTTLNRQGDDVGTQYRSIILYHSPEQKKQAEQSVQKAGKYFSDPIVTQVETLKEFYPAENYHQNYFRTNPKQAYCHYVIKPKIDKYLKTGFKVRKEGPEIV